MYSVRMIASYTEKYEKFTLSDGLELCDIYSIIVYDGTVYKPEFSVDTIDYVDFNNTIYPAQFAREKATGFCGELILRGYTEDEYGSIQRSILIKNKESADLIINQFNACRKNIA